MKFVPTKVSNTLARQLLKTQKNSPTILFIAGVTGAVTATVLACKATLELEEVLAEGRLDREIIKEQKDKTDSQIDKEVSYVVVRSSVKVIKLYGPSVLIGVASIAALTKSHNILTSRNAALTAAYAGIEKAFTEYQKRVVAEVGEDREREIRYGAEIKEVVSEDKNGPKKSKQMVVGPVAGYSPYARFFDETNANWNPVAHEYNIMFLTVQQNWLTEKLRARGHLFLNEVYDALGMEHTQAGSQVGWLKGAEGHEGHVDLGHFDSDNPRARAFVNGLEPAILLDFNHDGVIWDKI